MTDGAAVLAPDEARAAREAVARLDVGRPLPPVSDAEVATLWRQTKALADSGLWEGSKRGTALKAGEAFALALAGRELGLGPFEAMQQLHVLPDGKLEASSDLHATKVRERAGYDFEVFWIKSTTGAHYYNAQTGETKPAPDGEREAVAAKLDDPADLRPVVGCALRFTVDGEPRGVSTFTIEDSLRANLTRDRGNAKSLHVSYPRNMYYARAMTNGVSWYVPEAMGGLRVYGIGEIPRDDDGANLTGGEGGAESIADDLPTEVEALIARARELGHVGLQDRAVARMAVDGGADVLARWVRGATATLNRLDAARRAEPEQPTPEPAPEAQNGAGSPETAPEPVPPSEPAEGPQAPGEPPETGESADPSPDVPDAEAIAAETARLEAAIADAETAAEDASSRGDDASAEFHRSEAEQARGELAGLNPAQDSLDLGA